MSRRDREGAPHPVDLHVGLRVRAVRREAGLSLTRLAGRVGVAFQQLQKYEAGANRISASMLYELAGALKVPVASFYEGLGEPTCHFEPDTAVLLRTLLSTSEGLLLLQALVMLPEPARRHLAGLVQALATEASAAIPAPEFRRRTT